MISLSSDEDTNVLINYRVCDLEVECRIKTNVKTILNYVIVNCSLRNARNLIIFTKL